MLIKLRAPAGPARTEVLQLAEIFRARVVDVSERGLTLCVSGDPGKVRKWMADRELHGPDLGACQYVCRVFFRSRHSDCGSHLSKSSLGCRWGAAPGRALHHKLWF